MKRLCIFLFICILFLSGCRNNDMEENTVYVTAYPIKYVIEEIADDTVTVKFVPGSNSHSDSIDWTTQDILGMTYSDYLFYIGADFDNYIEQNIDSIFKDKDVELVNFQTSIVYNETHIGHTHSGEESNTSDDSNIITYDPHFWLDPLKLKEAALIVKEKLIVKYPENNEMYESNYVVLSAALEKLHEDFQEVVGNNPKPIIVSSNLFGYWHSSFGLESISISKDFHSYDDTITDILGFVEDAKHNDIKYVLYETNANSPGADLVILELNKDPNYNAKKGYLHSLGKLSKEDMDNGKNYLSIMYDNKQTIEEALK